MKRRAKLAVISIFGLLAFFYVASVVAPFIILGPSKVLEATLKVPDYVVLLVARAVEAIGCVAIVVLSFGSGPRLAACLALAFILGVGALVIHIGGPVSVSLPSVAPWVIAIVVIALHLSGVFWALVHWSNEALAMPADAQPTVQRRADERTDWEENRVMTLTFSGRTVKCGPHTWDAGYPILEASQAEGRVCLILDYSALPKKRQAENLRGYTVDGQLLWIAEHHTPLDCYTGFLDKDRVRAEIAANPTGPVAECFSGFVDTRSLLAYNFAGYQCLIDLASGKVIRMLFTK